MPTALVTAVLFLTAAIIRLAGINCELWLDEIWSIRLAQKAGSVLGVFHLNHDNNHWLNTLWLLFLGPGRPWWTYHLLSEAAGTGTVIVGWLVSRRSLPVLILLATSEFLIEYSSEARGYAAAGFFAVLCVWLLQRYLARPRRLTVVLMSVSALLGLLSHLTFVVILAGLIISAAVALKRRGSWMMATSRTAVWFAVPVAILITLYLVDIRNMERGGGPPTATDLPAQTAAMALGIPVGSPAAAIFGVAAWVLCAAQVWRLTRDSDSAWPVFAIALLFVPGLVFFWPRSDYLHPRYIYVAAPLLFILLGRELDHWFAGRWWAKFAAGAGLGLFVLSNGLLVANFLRYGRGDYLGALQFMVEETSGPRVVVGTDRHPESTLMVVQYYDQYHFKSASHLLTLNTEEWGDQWPQWMVAEEDLGLHVVTTDGVPFVRRAVFPKGTVSSGITWAIYEAMAGRPYARAENLRDLSR
jgi:hypothetical protein